MKKGLRVRKLYAMLWTSAGLGWRDAPSGGLRIGRFYFGLAVLAILIACRPVQPQPPQLPHLPQQPPSPLIYFPIYRQPPTDPLTVCLDYNPQAVAFYRLLTGDARQERPSLACHPALVRAAQRRAASLIASGLWSHCDPNGDECPNEVARNAGCKLPDEYAVRGNNIESLVAGVADAQIAFNALANSKSHSDHLFGRGSFFRVQDRVGITMVNAPGSAFTFYWVILISRCL